MHAVLTLSFDSSFDYFNNRLQSIDRSSPNDYNDEERKGHKDDNDHYYYHYSASA